MRMAPAFPGFGFTTSCRQWTRASVGALVFALWFTSTEGAANEDAPSPKERLQELKSALDRHRGVLRDLDNKERNLILTVSALDRDLSRLSELHDTARAKLETLNEKMVPLRENLASAELQLSMSQARLQKRLRALYVLSRGGAARHLLGAQSFDDLALRRRLLEDMAKTDATLVASYRAKVDEVNAQRRVVQERVREAKDIEQRLAEEEEILATTRKERAATMRRIEEEKELGVRAVKDIVRETNSISREIRAHLPTTIRPRSGKGILADGLLRPLRGTFLRGFGTSKDAASGAKVTSNGVHIRAALGVPVAAAGGGRVVFEGWQRGLGHIVILDHEEGHHTIYGHLSRGLVRQGERVVRGQTVGFVGDSASIEGPKLYFELRESGRPKNPAAYLRAE